MGNTSPPPVDETAGGLLDRWLAHRQQEEGGDAAPLAQPAQVEPEPEPVAVDKVDVGDQPEPTETETEPVAVDKVDVGDQPEPTETEPVAVDKAAVGDVGEQPEPTEPETVPEPDPVAVDLADVGEQPEPTEPETVPEPDPAAVDKADEGEQPVPIETVEEFEEFAHHTPALGGASGAPSSLGPEPLGEAPLAPAPAPEATGASVPQRPKPPTPARPPVAAPAPGLVLFSPRRGFRQVLVIMAALLAAGVGIAGYVAWDARTPTSFGVAGGLLAALFLVWKLRGRTTGTQVTIENGMLRVRQGKSHHLFPLASAHPPIDILGEPGNRSWKVLIQRRGMPPFVITRQMVDPAGFTEAIRQFRPEA